MLVKRSKDSDIAYYHIPHAYDESFFFTTHQDAQQIIPFDKVRLNFLTKQKINLKSLNRSELYSTKKDEEPVLLLSKAKRNNKKHFNTFASIYKHLIRSIKQESRRFYYAIIHILTFID